MADQAVQKSGLTGASTGTPDPVRHQGKPLNVAVYEPRSGATSLIDTLEEGARTRPGFAVTRIDDGSWQPAVARLQSIRPDALVVMADAAAPSTREAITFAAAGCLAGVGHIILAVNGMDTAANSMAAFEAHARRFETFLRSLDAARNVTLMVVPVSNMTGTNREAAAPGSDLLWYRGPTLWEAFDTAGNLKAGPSAPCRSNETARQFSAELLWVSEAPLLTGRPYVLQTGNQTSVVHVPEIRHAQNADTMAQLAARQLVAGDLGVCTITSDEALPVPDPAAGHLPGFFSLVDRQSGQVAAFGCLKFALRRSRNIKWHSLDVSKAGRADQKGQTPCCLWLTGLSGAGKSTIANQIDKKLFALGRHAYILDGDNVRHGLNSDLGFTDADRVQNIRRVAEVARLMVDAGLITIVSFISPFRAERDLARSRLAPGEFLEIYVATPLAVCETRDPKGLYQKARAGSITNFTGISSPYEEPAAPDLVLDTTRFDPGELAEQVIGELRRRGYV